MHRIEINPDDPASIQRALNTEWLLTNGLGGYAMGTALGVNTRRYHGLLVAATKPPVGRVVALHSVIEQLVIPCDDGTEDVIDLSTQQFVGGDGEPMLHPNGWRRLAEFESEPGGVSWRWVIAGIEVSKFLLFLPGRNQLSLNYSLIGIKGRARLKVRPLVLLRDLHGLEQERADLFAHVCGESKICVRRGPNEIAIEAKQRPYDSEMSYAWHDEQQWWSRLAYSNDRARGQDWIEAAWSPGSFAAEATAGPLSSLSLLVTLTKPSVKDKQQFDRVLREPGTDTREWSASNRLQIAGQDFRVARWMNDERFVSIIAGYPWFSDWGRDTMISLPGLLLCTGRVDEARSCLSMFARHLRNGLIPNTFDEYSGGGHYNTVDAPLWFVHAVHALWKATESPSPFGSRESLAACREVIAAYRRGTDFSIRMDEADGLIAAGDASTQLTWMDAKRDGVVFTPRHGKAVEINALWHNALRCLAEMTDDEQERRELSELAQRIQESVREAFWWVERKCLHDCLQPVEGRDAASRSGRWLPDGKLRPNQIFAVSLPFAPLAPHSREARAVVDIVGGRLLTPFGLRTLDRDDPDYKPRFEGDLFQRDAAYHQGTVWPWLIGPYCEALLRVENFSDDAKRCARAIIQPLIDEMSNAEGGRCLGQIAEVYDGDPPHRPAGCVAQAWSVAEVLRIHALSGDEG